MFGSQVFEVALGLVFIYLLLSLVCSGIHDWIAGALNTKADALEKRLGELLQNSELVKEFYNHPLIKGQADKSLYDKLFRRVAKPAYIDSKVFSIVLSELMQDKNCDIAELYKEAGDKIKKQNVLKTLLSVVNEEVGKAEDKVEEKAKVLKVKIEDWFNVSMNQMSIWYKQKVRFVMFFIALVITAYFNVDTITIGKILYQDDALRQKVVSVVEKEMKVTEAPAADASKNPLQQARAFEAKVSDLGLPLGWKWDTPATEDLCGRPNDAKGWLLKIIGLLLTIVASSMGAPFWFDIIRKMMRLKSGKKAAA